MIKHNMLSLIINNALLYDEELNNKNILFVLSDYSQIETYFNGSKYKHLIGIVSPLSGHEFYEKCISHTLTNTECSFRSDGCTGLKLQVINQLINIAKTAKMAGVFDGNRVNLQTNKLVGNTRATVGFVKDRKYYVPNTLLKEDIRDVAQKPTKKIIAVAIKGINDRFYTDFSYISDSLSESELSELSNLLCDLFENGLPDLSR